MLNKIDKLDKMIKQWEDLSPQDKQTFSVMAGLGAGLILKGLLKIKRNKKEMEIIKLVVPKDAELFIFVKGGK